MFHVEQFYCFVGVVQGACPLITICGTRQRSAAIADGRVRHGARLGCTLWRIACRVPCCMGPLRASAAVLVTFGGKSDRQSLLKALFVAHKQKNTRFLLCSFVVI